MNPSDDAGGLLRRGARLWPLAAMAAVLALAVALGAHRLISLDTLVRHQAALLSWAAGHAVTAPLLFTLALTAAVVASLPAAAVFSVTGGFLFGFAGFVYVHVGMTVGSVIVHLIARGALGDRLLRRAGPVALRLAERFRRDAFWYLLAVRLSGVFPFFIVNLVPASVGMRVGPYALATAIGIAPVVFVFVALGRGFGAALAEGHAPDLSLALDLRIVLPLLAAAAVSLLPVLLRGRFGRGPQGG